MQIFDLVDVRPGREFTGRMVPSAERLFGPGALTYAAVPLDADHCRLIGRVAIGNDGFNRLRAAVLNWGDLVMMRRQLLNLKKYAERDALTTRT
jgi:hypothetical protein